MAPASESGGTRRRTPASRRGLTGDSTLLGGEGGAGSPLSFEAGAEEPRAPRREVDARRDPLELPRPPPPSQPPAPRALRELIPSAEPGRTVDDWGRSQRVFDLIAPVLDFYYRYWFRV